MTPTSGQLRTRCTLLVQCSNAEAALQWNDDRAGLTSLTVVIIPTQLLLNNLSIAKSVRHWWTRVDRVVCWATWTHIRTLAWLLSPTFTQHNTTSFWSSKAMGKLCIVQGHRPSKRMLATGWTFLAEIRNTHPSNVPDFLHDMSLLLCYCCAAPAAVRQTDWRMDRWRNTRPMLCALCYGHGQCNKLYTFVTSNDSKVLLVQTKMVTQTHSKLKKERQWSILLLAGCPSCHPIQQCQSIERNSCYWFQLGKSHQLASSFLIHQLLWEGTSHHLITSLMAEPTLYLLTFKTVELPLNKCI